MTKKSSVSSRREQLHRKKPDDITLTEKMMKDLKALKRRKIDLSDEDAPEITTSEKSVVGKFYRPVKSKSQFELTPMYWIGLGMPQKNTKR